MSFSALALLTKYAPKGDALTLVARSGTRVFARLNGGSPVILPLVAGVGRSRGRQVWRETPAPKTPLYVGVEV